jgi:hypothetical protein
MNGNGEAQPVLISGGALFARKPLLFIFEQHIESGQRSINAGDVLLQVYFVFIAQLFVGVDLLFQHTQAVAQHHYFVEEHVDG